MIAKLMLGLGALVFAVYLGEHAGLIPWLSCHSGLRYPHHYLATKTPYREEDVTTGHHSSHGKCEAIQLWMIVRHGTRNPSAKVIKRIHSILPGLRKEILDAHEKGSGELCTADLDALKGWTPPKISESDEKILVEQGEKELRGIGKRFKERFPELLNKRYTNGTYKFKFTKTERAEKSCMHFVEEVIGSEEYPAVWYPQPLAADPVLRFYKGCPKWKKNVDKNPEAYKERMQFETTPLFESVKQNVQRRGGLMEAVGLETLETIYMTCAFETAWNPSTPSPWCHLFDEEDLEKMQYRQDLEYYWVDGYGYELTYKQACPAVKDMAEHFRAKIDKPSDAPAVIAYFTHSGTLLKLISRLGLFNDTKRLLHNNYHLHHNRQWRTSKIDKFATNIAAVLYKCPEEHKVGLFFQEQAIAIPECGKDLCPLSRFFHLYHSVLTDCDMNKMCSLK